MTTEAPTLRIRLTARERKLILDRTLIGGEVEQHIQRLRDGGSTLILSADDFEDLIGHVAAAANHCPDAGLQRILDRLYTRLANDLDSASGPPVLLGSDRAERGTRFTPKQGQYLAFIYYYAKIHGRAPAEADLQRYFKVSPPTVHQMVLSLEARGLISRRAGEPRSLRLLLTRAELPDLVQRCAIPAVRSNPRMQPTSRTEPGSVRPLVPVAFS